MEVIKSSLYTKKDEMEFYPTQDWVKKSLYDLIPKDLKVEAILDPCCGTGGLEIENSIYNYTLYDIKDYGYPGTIVTDFLSREYDGSRYDIVIINPPYSLLDEFVKKSFLYSDNILLIGPLLSIKKLFNNYITKEFLDWRISQSYNVLVSIGCFLLQKNKSFSFKPLTIKNHVKTLQDKVVLINEHKENKPFICIRITKARILRGVELIQDCDIYDANDDSVFYAQKANINIKKGEKLPRNIIYFDTKEKLYEFKNLLNSKEDQIRKYAYEHSGCVLKMKNILDPEFL